MNKYRSRYEANIAKDLKAKGIKFEYETVKIPFYLSKKGIEAKGRFVSSDRTKMKQVVKENPSLDIRMLFMRDQWCTKLKKKRYSDWCNDHGIKYAFGISLPKEWLRGSR